MLAFPYHCDDNLMINDTASCFGDLILHLVAAVWSMFISAPLHYEQKKEKKACDGSCDFSGLLKDSDCVCMLRVCLIGITGAA